MAYAKPEDLAERYGKSRTWVVLQCASGRFPHLRVGRSIRFKPEHVEAIEREMERLPRDDNSGRIPGFSARSRSKYAKANP